MTESPIIVERSRTMLHAHGRDPVRMIHGIATADIETTTPEQGVYTAYLTPKGRMVSDGRVFRTGADGAELLLDVPTDAASALRDYFARSVPPLFARFDDVSEEWAVLGVYGTGASQLLEAAARTALDDAPPMPEPETVVDERVVRFGDGEGFAASTRITGDEGWDFFVPSSGRDRWLNALAEAGARPVEPDVLEALRVAAGTPRWGRELSEDVIPLEAGLLERAISQTKGCYTGQEVIVRILHRGHVNRHLRRLHFSDGAPDPGTELFQENNDRSRGTVTSAVENQAGALGLGYVRREIEPPAELRVGSPDGPAVGVEALD